MPSTALRYHPILTAVVHDVLARGETFDTLADLCEAVKCRAAQLRLPYDGDRITEAIAVIGRTRPWRVCIRQVARRREIVESDEIRPAGDDHWAAETAVEDLQTRSLADHVEAGRQRAAQWRREWRLRRGALVEEDHRDGLPALTGPRPMPVARWSDPEREAAREEAARVRAREMGIDL